MQTDGQSSFDDSSRAVASYAMLVTTIMIVLSVQILVNLSVLKGCGLHPLDDLATFDEVLEQFKLGEIEVCSSFVFPDTLLEQPFECYLLEQPFECYIAPNLSGPFQTVARVGEMGEIYSFSRYLKYVITPSDQPAFADVGCQEKPRDAFRIMMAAQLVLRIPEKVTDQRTGKY